MIKNLKALGQELSKTQQKTVKGGFGLPCRTFRDCMDYYPFAFPGDFSCRDSRFGYGKVCVAN